MAGPAAGVIGKFALQLAVKLGADAAIAGMEILVQKAAEYVQRMGDVIKVTNYLNQALGLFSNQLTQLGGVFAFFGDTLSGAISAMQMLMPILQEILDFYGPLKYFFADWTAQMLGAAAQTGAFAAALAGIMREGLEMNATLEASHITVAALIAQYKDLYEVRVEDGKEVRKQVGYIKQYTDAELKRMTQEQRSQHMAEQSVAMSQKMEAAMIQAGQAQQVLTLAAAESPFTTGELLNGFQAVYTQLGKYNVDSVRAAELTAKFARVASVAGVSAANMASQLRLWLQGIGRVTSPLSAFMTGIGLSRDYMRKLNEELKAAADIQRKANVLEEEDPGKYAAQIKALTEEAKAKTDAALDVIEIRITAFTVAGIQMAASWRGIFSNLMEQFQIFSAYVTKDAFEEIKKVFFAVVDDLDAPVRDASGKLIGYQKKAIGLLTYIFNFARNEEGKLVLGGKDKGPLAIFLEEIRKGIPALQGFFKLLVTSFARAAEATFKWINSLLQFFGTQDGQMYLANLAALIATVGDAIWSVVKLFLALAGIKLDTPQTAVAGLFEAVKKLAVMVLELVVAFAQMLAAASGISETEVSEGFSRFGEDAGERIETLTQFGEAVVEVKKRLEAIKGMKLDASLTLPQVDPKSQGTFQEIVKALLGDDGQDKKGGGRQRAKPILLDYNFLIEQMNDVNQAYLELEAKRIETSLDLLAGYHEALQSVINLEADLGLAGQLEVYIRTSKSQLDVLNAQIAAEQKLYNVRQRAVASDLRALSRQGAEDYLNYTNEMLRALQEDDPIARQNAERTARQNILTKAREADLAIIQRIIAAQAEGVELTARDIEAQQQKLLILIEQEARIRQMQQEERKNIIDTIAAAGEVGFQMDTSGFTDELKNLLGEVGVVSQSVILAADEDFTRLENYLRVVRQSLAAENEKAVKDITRIAKLKQEEALVIQGIKARARLLEIEEARANIAAQQKSMTEAEMNLAAKQADIQRAQSEGRIDEREAQRQLFIAAEAYRDATQDAMQNMLNWAATVKDPVLKAEIQKIYEEWRRVGTVINETQKVLSTSIRNSFAKLFEDLSSGTVKASDAFRNMAQSILGSLNQLIQKRLADKLFKSLFGEGKIFGKLGVLLGLEDEKMSELRVLEGVDQTKPPSGTKKVDITDSGERALATSSDNAVSDLLSLRQALKGLSTDTEGNIINLRSAKSLERLESIFSTGIYITENADKIANALNAPFQETFGKTIGEPTTLLANNIGKYFPDLTRRMTTLSSILSKASSENPLSKLLGEGKIGLDSEGRLVASEEGRKTLEATLETLRTANPIPEPKPGSAGAVEAAAERKSASKPSRKGKKGSPAGVSALPPDSERADYDATVPNTDSQFMPADDVQLVPQLSADALQPVTSAITTAAADVVTKLSGVVTSVKDGLATTFQTFVDTNYLPTLGPDGVLAQIPTALTEIKAVLDTIAANTNLTALADDLSGATSSLGTEGGGGSVEAATGGYISGAGGPKDDLIPAWLSNGEYVINAAAVKKLGVPFLKMVNNADKIKGHFLGALISQVGNVFSGLFSGVQGLMGAMGLGGTKGKDGGGGLLGGLNLRGIGLGQILPMLLSLLPIKSPLLKRLMPLLVLAAQKGFEKKATGGLIGKFANGGLIQAFANGGAVRTKGGIQALGLGGPPLGGFKPSSPTFANNIFGNTGGMPPTGKTGFFQSKLGGTLLSIGLAVGMMLLSRLFAPKGEDKDPDRTPDPYGWNPDTLTFYKRPIITGRRQDLASSKVTNKMELAEMAALEKLRAKARVPQKFALGGLVSPTSLVGDVPITGGNQVKLPDILDSLQRRLPDEVMNVNQNINISTPDVHSFKASKATVQRDLGRMAQGGLRRPRRRY